MTGKTPSFIDELQRRDMTGAMCVVRRLSNQVGTGSMQHDLHGDLCNSLTISSTVTGSKQLIGGTNLVVMHRGAADAVDKRILLTLLLKNVAKSSADSVEVVGLDGGCNRVFTARHRACGL